MRKQYIIKVRNEKEADMLMKKLDDYCYVYTINRSDTSKWFGTISFMCKKEEIKQLKKELGLKVETVLYSLEI